MLDYGFGPVQRAYMSNEPNTASWPLWLKIGCVVVFIGTMTALKFLMEGFVDSVGHEFLAGMAAGGLLVGIGVWALPIIDRW